MVTFFRILSLLFGAGWTSVSPSSLVLYMKYLLKAALLSISASKLVAPFF